MNKWEKELFAKVFNNKPGTEKYVIDLIRKVERRNLDKSDKLSKSMRESWRYRSNEDGYIEYGIFEVDEIVNNEDFETRIYEDLYISPCSHVYDCCGCQFTLAINVKFAGKFASVIHHVGYNV